MWEKEADIVFSVGEWKEINEQQRKTSRENMDGKNITVQEVHFYVFGGISPLLALTGRS